MEWPDPKNVVIVAAVLAQTVQMLGFTMPYAKQATANEIAQFHFSDEFKACNAERIAHQARYHPPSQ